MQKEQLRLDLINVKNTLNKSLTKRLYDKTGTYSSATVEKYYGSWSLAMQEIFGTEPRKREARKPRPCLNCETITKNAKFCSSSCSASFNNSVKNGRTTGRRSVARTCKICNAQISWDFRRCESCRPLIKTNIGEWKHIETITKSEVLTNDTQRYRRIRAHARKIAEKNGLLQKCLICNYKHCVECAHINPIASFPDQTLLLEINTPTNLCGLCPNHHWEYDHNLLTLT